MMESIWLGIAILVWWPAAAEAVWLVYENVKYQVLGRPYEYETWDTIFPKVDVSVACGALLVSSWFVSVCLVLAGISCIAMLLRGQKLQGLDKTALWLTFLCVTVMAATMWANSPMYAQYLLGIGVASMLVLVHIDSIKRLRRHFGDHYTKNRVIFDRLHMLVWIVLTVLAVYLPTS